MDMVKHTLYMLTKFSPSVSYIYSMYDDGHVNFMIDIAT